MLKKQVLYQCVKRLFDFGFALLGVILSFPLWILCAVLIVREDRGPVFYTQKRVGKNGKLFAIIKFRSMLKDAEEKTGAVIATANDPRVTSIGKFMRRTALDELPQLLCILFGKMSFVGPRPERPELVKQFKKEVHGYEARFSVIPGLTGLAQVRGRYDTSVRHKLNYDLFYVSHQNFWLEMKLVLLSFWNTFRGRWEYGEKRNK